MECLTRVSGEVACAVWARADSPDSAVAGMTSSVCCPSACLAGGRSDQ